jgi:hypothetical protein
VLGFIWFVYCYACSQKPKLLPSSYRWIVMSDFGETPELSGAQDAADGTLHNCFHKEHKSQNGIWTQEIYLALSLFSPLMPSVAPPIYRDFNRSTWQASQLQQPNVMLYILSHVPCRSARRSAIARRYGPAFCCCSVRSHPIRKIGRRAENRHAGLATPT